MSIRAIEDLKNMRLDHAFEFMSLCNGAAFVGAGTNWQIGLGIFWLACAFYRKSP